MYTALKHPSNQVICSSLTYGYITATGTALRWSFVKRPARVVTKLISKRWNRRVPVMKYRLHITLDQKK